MSMKRTPEWLADYERKTARHRSVQFDNIKPVSLVRGPDLKPVAMSGGVEGHAVCATSPPDLLRLDSCRGAGIKPGPLTLIGMCRGAGLPEPTPEYVFHPTRKWRFDYAWPVHRLALECNGGIWTQGRHNRGKGSLNDQEKLSEAAVLGWRVLYATPDDLATIGFGRIVRALEAA